MSPRGLEVAVAILHGLWGWGQWMPPGSGACLAS